MITCLSALIDLRAMLVICTDCISQSLPTTRVTMLLAYRMANGVSNIESTMAARMGLNSCGGTRLF
ncbi:hypothetical protein FQZ97_958330 [compost metagenome]